MGIVGSRPANPDHSLPPELVLQILRDHLPAPTFANGAARRRNLAAFARVDRFWHSIARDVLFRDVLLEDKARVARFCASVAGTDLPRGVVSLRLGGMFGRHRPSTADYVPALQLCQGVREIWLAHVRFNVLDLQWAQKLEELVLRSPDLRQTKVLFPTLQQVQLPALRRLSLAYVGPTNTPVVTDLSFFFPALQELILLDFCPSPDTMLYLSPYSIFTKVTAVLVTNSPISSQPRRYSLSPFRAATTLVLTDPRPPDGLLHDLPLTVRTLSIPGSSTAWTLPLQRLLEASPNVTELQLAPGATLAPAGVSVSDALPLSAHGLYFDGRWETTYNNQARFLDDALRVRRASIAPAVRENRPFVS